MRFLAKELQAAGLNFISAKARHRHNAILIDEIIVATHEDLEKVNRWAGLDSGKPRIVFVAVRVATAEELAEFEARKDE